NPCRFAPALEIGVRVAAEDEEEFALVAQRLERIDGERGALPIKLDMRDAEAGFVTGSRGQHREPVLRARARSILLQRRAARGDEVHVVKTDLVERRVRDREMADVHRVEGAAEYPDPAHSSPARSLHSISRVPMRTVSPSFAPSARSSRSIPVRMSCR